MKSKLRLHELPTTVKRPANARAYWDASAHHTHALFFALGLDRLIGGATVPSPWAVLSPDESTSVTYVPFTRHAKDGWWHVAILSHCTNMRRRAQLWHGVWRLPKGKGTPELLVVKSELLKMPHPKNTKGVRGLEEAMPTILAWLRLQANEPDSEELTWPMNLGAVSLCLTRAVAQGVLPAHDIPCILSELSKQPSGMVPVFEFMQVASLAISRAPEVKQAARSLKLLELACKAAVDTEVVYRSKRVR